MALAHPSDMVEGARLRASAAAQRYRELEALIDGLADEQARFEPDTAAAVKAAVAARRRARESRVWSGQAHDRAARALEHAATVALALGDADLAARHRDEANTQRLVAARHRADPF